MELVLALIIARWIVNGTVDVTSMITGNQPPSKTYRDAKGENKEDGPLIRAFKAWWADAIEDIDEAKNRRRLESKEEKEQERQRRKAERQALIDGMNEKINQERQRREEEENHRRRPEVGEVPPVDGVEVDEVDEVPPVDGVGDLPEEQAPTAEPAPPVDEVVIGTVEPGGAEAEQPEDKKVIIDADIVEQEGTPRLQILGGGRAEDDEWSVYGKPQIYAVPDMTEGQPVPEARPLKGMTMTEVQAVEGGITSHIDWTAQMADAQTRASAHAEIVGATMFQGDNGPARLALIRRIQEAHQQMREMYLQVNAVLVNDKRLIGEAYAATGNQAGGKTYTTN
jgi:hypothetical protein